ncbi:plasmid-related protein [Filibacter tadaridae]|uniref:Phage-Barnase-EndoU-ColicinE5/D-RelE like nuclease 3 domain-containing protein n=1 Tax=Filibacter tadaridae TaxID=2483811 RepID=A0A3P5WCG6_9BACL|nr:hypothetical protein FILTAD_00023 [Filibacter tadaridae]
MLGADDTLSDLFSFDENSVDPLLVGEIDTIKIQSLIGINFPTSDVYIYPGAIKHIKKKHPGVWEQYGHSIPLVLSEPDYIGKNPKEPNSIELYKQLGDHLLLAIKLDPTGYLFVSSLYDLKNAVAKINKRLISKRIIPYV